MGGSTADAHSESNRTDNVTIPKACSKDNTQTGHTIVVEDGEGASLEDEFATLRSVLARGMEGFGDRVSDSTGPEETLSTDEYDKVAPLSSAIRYIRYLERALRQEKTALEDSLKGRDAGIVE